MVSARDAVERTRLRGRREQHALANDEDVLAGPVGDVTVVVQHDRLVVAGLQALDLGEHAVDVLAGGLRRGGQRVLRVAAPAAHLHPDPLLQRILAEVGAPRPHRDRDVDGRLQRVHADLAVPTERERPDVARLQVVRADDLLRGVLHGLGREGDVQVVELRAAVQALEVLVQVPDGGAAYGLVSPDAFEDAAAVVQRVAEHVDLRVAPVHQLAVHPDLLDLGDRHRRTSWCRRALIGSPVRGPPG